MAAVGKTGREGMERHAEGRLYKNGWKSMEERRVKCELKYVLQASEFMTMLVMGHKREASLEVKGEDEFCFVVLV